ncbi:hypothetical protein FQA39_LY12008 [Lamprigera yunnana]|nr:hypothetical protein FQA39_LY12008 [Lamprigera yunnana]
MITMSNCEEEEEYKFDFEICNKLSELDSKNTKTSTSESKSRTTTSLGPVQEIPEPPFTLRWAFGINTSVDVLNLTTKWKSVIFYSCTHTGVLYDYVTNTMNFLQGHKNCISSISTDETGRWLVTADKGEDSTIIIWDSIELMPINTIFNAHPDNGSAACAISPNAKYLISVENNVKPNVNFWLWTNGNDTPNDSYMVTSNFGTPRRICFNSDIQEHIWIAFEKQVIFMEWDPILQKLLSPVLPAVRHAKKWGFINDCTYLEKCHQCVACTTEGVILVFGSSYYTKDYHEDQLLNDKIYVKAIKISNNSIMCIKSVEGLIVTGDALGHIKFYDNRVKLLYWCQNFSLSSIKFASFNLEKRRYKITDPYDILDECLNLQLNFDEIYEDKSDSIECLYANLVPTDATVESLPFVVRDFVIVSENGQVGKVDFLKNECHFFNRRICTSVTAIDSHDEHPYICIGYANGSISLCNYETKELIAEGILQKNFTDIAGISYIKFAPEGMHLACGQNNGSLWFVDPILLTPKQLQPLDYVNSKIKKIVFAPYSKYCAYYDIESTLVILKYSVDDEEWVLLGKMRAHYKPMNDILFSPYAPPRLFSIGDDRKLQEYDLINCNLQDIVLNASERIEQSAIPISFMYHPPNAKGESSYLFMCDNQYKFKIFNDTTFMCHKVALGPAYGCYEKSPVHMIQMLPKHDNKYLIYANDTAFGIQMFPPDGNPNKYIGIIGNPNKIIHFCSSNDGKYVFTIGVDDSSVLMWETNTSAVEKYYIKGGTSLEPYHCLIEGGMTGWLFKEMEDSFYYMQILHQGEHSVLPRKVSDYIPVVELPDLMRAVGFYPTEYEIETMIIDIKYRDFDITGKLKEEASFVEFIQLYVNYRLPHGVPIETLKSQFEVLCSAGVDPQFGTMDRDSFLSAICERGEIFARNKAHTCLTTLMHENKSVWASSEEMDFSFLPSTINFDTFLKDMLGIDLNRQMVEHNEDATNLEKELEC